MIKRLLLLVLIVVSTHVSLIFADKTTQIHAEVKKQNNPNATQKTHPVLYDLVKELATKAQVPMPRYITIFSTEYTYTDKNGIHRRGNKDMQGSIDVVGDLYLCLETLTDLSYEEIKGVVALTIAEKIIDKPVKLFATGAGTFALTIASLYGANKRYELNIWSKFDEFYNRLGSNSKDELVGLAVSALLIPALAATSVYSNHLQRKIDSLAAEITSPETIINAIVALEKVTETYMKENIFVRFAKAYNIDSVYNKLFYAVRAFTNDERIAYLQKINNY